ncbi:hypothetical protein GCM10023156_38130 [Novipirellula rosea]|uniref:N-acetyltransferase domain-containing protein n=2 Tax=Novipirellula rosea TaxID=1031540 RepID=A0ABP8N363_9BACT
MYFAFPAEPDSSRLVSFVIVDDNQSSFVEWIYVEEGTRRSGVATEVLQFIEQHGNELTISGATPEGDMFTEAYTTQFPRLGLANNAYSLMVGKSKRHEIWVTRLEQTPGNDLDIVQIWPRDEHCARPVSTMTIYPAKSKAVKVVFADEIYRELSTSELLDGLETIFEPAEV